MTRERPSSDGATSVVVLVPGYSTQSPSLRILSDNKMTFFLQWNGMTVQMGHRRDNSVLLYAARSCGPGPTRMDLEEELGLTVCPSFRSLRHRCPAFQGHSDEQNGVIEFDPQSILVRVWFALTTARGWGNECTKPESRNLWQKMN